MYYNNAKQKKFNNSTNLSSDIEHSNNYYVKQPPITVWKGSQANLSYLM